jgi:transcription initiation factor TFIID subunit TAF12
MGVTRSAIQKKRLNNLQRAWVLPAGNNAAEDCDTKEEAEQFKQKSEEQYEYFGKWPEMKVEIKQIEEQDQ